MVSTLLVGRAALVSLVAGAIAIRGHVVAPVPRMVVVALNLLGGQLAVAPLP